MIIAIDQPNYLPWKGYFDLIHDVDLFVFYNDVQYTVRDWRSRNKIITPDGEKWISVPAGNNRNRLICEVKINDSSWQIKHLKTIKFAYSKSPFYKKYIDFFEHVYQEKKWQFLYELDQYLTVNIAKEFLGIKTKFEDSRNYPKYGAKHDKLMSLLTSVCSNSVKGGKNDLYISGPAAKAYIKREDFKQNNIKLAWKNYEGYPEYKQNTNLFSHQVSIIDLLFNVGDEAPYYIWGWRGNSKFKAYITDY